jgi:hypothetical protein
MKWDLTIACCFLVETCGDTATVKTKIYLCCLWWKNYADKWNFHITILLSEKSEWNGERSVLVYFSGQGRHCSTDSRKPATSFCSERPSWMKIGLWKWMPVKYVKLWWRQEFQVRNGYNLRFKYELYLCRYFMNSLTCSNATITFLSGGFSSTPLKSHSIDENWYCWNIVHKAVVSARPLFPKM